MGQLTQNFVDLAMATCKEGRHPSLTVWEAQQLLHAWNDRDALRARVAELEGLLKRARPRVESFAFTTKYEEEARAARELAREIRAGLAGGSAGSREDA